MAGMKARVGPKIIAVKGSGIGNARVAQHEREDGSKGRPHNKEGAKGCDPVPKRSLQNKRSHVETCFGSSRCVSSCQGTTPRMLMFMTI